MNVNLFALDRLKILEFNFRLLSFWAVLARYINFKMGRVGGQLKNEFIISTRRQRENFFVDLSIHHEKSRILVQNEMFL